MLFMILHVTYHETIVCVLTTSGNFVVGLRGRLVKFKALQVEGNLLHYVFLHAFALTCPLGNLFSNFE